MKLAFLGGGNMATAIIDGILGAGLAKAEEICVSDKDTAKLAIFEKRGIKTAQDNDCAANFGDIIFIAVKPSIVETVAAELISCGDISEKLIISIAAGVELFKLEKFFDNKEMRIIRVMPNMPAMVGCGMSALCKNSYVTDEDMKTALGIFSTFGKALEVAENQMDAVTAVSGSGPAYVYMFIEALADGGVLNGLPRDSAYLLAAQTVLGAAKTVLETGKHPAELKDMVCSPAGTTIEAVASLESDGLRGSIIKAVNACAEKSSKLSS